MQYRQPNNHDDGDHIIYNNNQQQQQQQPLSTKAATSNMNTKASLQLQIQNQQEIQDYIRAIMTMDHSTSNEGTTTIRSSNPRVQSKAHQTSSTPNINNDNTCDRSIAAALDHPKDGFASELQYVARLLQMAVSTQRVLVMTDGWKSAYYPPHGCSGNSSSSESGSTTESQPPQGDGGWTCLWQPISNCQVKYDTGATAATEAAHHYWDKSSSLGIGILSSTTTKRSDLLFDPVWYGAEEPMVHAPTSFSRRSDRPELRPDIVPHWERAYGRYWVRAQMAHFLWRPNPQLQALMDARLPTEIVRLDDDNDDDTASTSRRPPPPPPFIGFHIRYTDNIKDLENHFARNATMTRSFDRFMEFAEAIRGRYATADTNKSKDKQKPDPLEYIYLATDNADILKQSQHSKWNDRGWTFIVQKGVVQRSTTTTSERMWFQHGRGAAAGGIATDIEVLRRADFLVGSFQSNVYRLACELNTAWNVEKYPVVGDTMQQRHWTVDVEWYEDP